MRTRVEILLLILLASGIAHGVDTGGPGVNRPQFPVGERCIAIPASTAFVGPTAPTATTYGTFRCYMFTGGDELFAQVEVPDDWDEVSDLTLKIYWTPQAGDPLENGQIVAWDAEYRSIDIAAVQSLSNGTSVTITPSHEQSGAGAETDPCVCTATIPYSTGFQHVAEDDLIGIYITESVTKTYDSDPAICLVEVCYNSIRLPNHT